MNKLQEIGRLPEDAILVIADVVGLYPHIPHEEGLHVMREALNKSVPTDDLVDLARLVLTNNNLTFNDKHYIQILDTAIGTKMTPLYANIFMGKLESAMLEGSPDKPHTWFRLLMIFS